MCLHFSSGLESILCKPFENEALEYKKCIITARLLYYIVISMEAHTFGMRNSLSVYEISIPVTTITVCDASAMNRGGF